MPALAQVASTTPHSAIRTVGQLARSIPGALRLESGDPDFTTPEHIIAAAAAAARAGFTHYGPSAGIDSLRDAIDDQGGAAERLRLAAASKWS